MVYWAISYEFTQNVFLGIFLVSKSYKKMLIINFDKKGLKFKLYFILTVAIIAFNILLLKYEEISSLSFKVHSFVSL